MALRTNRRDEAAMIKRRAFIFGMAASTLLAGCSSGLKSETLATSDDRVAELARALMTLGPEVDPEEAARAARISFEYPQVLAEEYEIEDSALIHNIKVNTGLKPRGLCWHWAVDMAARLRAEEFRTLDINRAVAPDRGFHLEHNTAVITRRGGSTYDGILVDPWRYAGVLFWSRLPDDRRYQWEDYYDFYAARPDRPLPA